MTAEHVREAVSSAPRFRRRASGRDREAPGAVRPDANPLFKVVPFADLATREPEPIGYWWQGRIPEGEVTLLGAHGGTGKSFIALMLAACTAVGAPLFGVPTRRGRVIFYSAEDSARVVRIRLHKICILLDLNIAEVAERMQVLDATEGEPVLFQEIMKGRARQGTTTKTYETLAEAVEKFGADVLIVDNASDAYDASEIERAKVRAFVRSLAKFARPGRAVLLLSHVNRQTASGVQTSEGYSGSTAWHNSVRSRLFLNREKDGGTLLLEHQKSNHGPLAPTLSLLWPEGGLPELDVGVTPFVQGIADRNDTKALLRLIHEFTERGEFVSTATSGPSNSAKVLGGQRGFPKRKPAETFNLLRDAERKMLLERTGFRTAGRKDKERWELTPAGLELIGVAAPVAPVAPVAPTDASSATGADGAPVAPVAPGGYRGEWSAQTTGAEPSS